VIPMDLGEIARVVGGQLAEADPSTPITRPFSADSRTVEPGGMFVADMAGHDFAADAMANGATAVLSSRPLPGIPCVVAPPAPGHEVDASVVALGVLAKYVVERLPDLTVIAVTGSQGKTTTKDLMARVFGDAGPTIAPVASLNNELGAPITALRADAETRYLVAEMGARNIGNLRYLTSLVRPHVSVVLNVGKGHVGFFGSQEGIAQAKGELIEALPVSGTAVLNADDPLVRAMAPRTEAAVTYFGLAADAEVRAEGVELDDRGCPGFVLVTPEGKADVQLNYVGVHYVTNALAAAAAARAVGLDVDAVAASLNAAKPQARWRMAVSDRSDGVRIVNDGYNANPDSMRAALEALPTLAKDRRTWAVLGEMLELGAASTDEHATVGRLAVRQGVSRLVVVGDGARAIYDAARAEGKESVFVPDADSAYELLRSELRPGDVVLVKSSRDAGLRYLGDRLVADVPPVEGPA
jgi:UDP-N-acetylmuramoyl-tripeptide--D-alanyl-D-alanine ligase